MSNIYAIGCHTSKFDVTMGEEWQSALPTLFFKKGNKNITQQSSALILRCSIIERTM
jgi:hypothetical protein